MRHLYAALLACTVLAVLASGCSGHVENGSGLNNTSDQLWPRLFNTGNLSGYQYDMVNATTGSLERQLTVRYGEDPYVRVNWTAIAGGAPVRVTKVNVSWLRVNRWQDSTIYTNENDGSVIHLDFWIMSDGFIDNLEPVWEGNPVRNHPWIVRAAEGDLEARFDDWMGPSLHVSGFDFTEYNGNTYYCSVYESYDDTTFRAWRNASFPVPLKIIANVSDESIMKGNWTFELASWS